METFEKFIYAAAGTVLSMLIIGLAIVHLGGNRAASEAVSRQDERISNKVMQTKWASYHGTEITGDEVIGIIERFTEDGLFVRVSTPEGDNTYTTGSQSEIMGIRDSSGSKYINPQTKFIGKLEIDNVTEEVLGIFLVPAW